MIIDLTKSVFTKSETEFIIDKLKQASTKGFIRDKPEDNPSLIASYKGVEGKGISPKWNVKIYSYNKKKKGHSLVPITTDLSLLPFPPRTTTNPFSRLISSHFKLATSALRIPVSIMSISKALSLGVLEHFNNVCTSSTDRTGNFFFLTFGMVTLMVWS